MQKHSLPILAPGAEDTGSDYDEIEEEWQIDLTKSYDEIIKEFDESLSFKCQWFILRLTPQGVYDVDKVKEYLYDIGSMLWVIGQESSARGVPHFHVVFAVYTEESTVDMKVMRESVTTMFRPLFMEAAQAGIKHNGNLVKWQGGPQFNIKLSTDHHAAISYALKECGDNYWLGSDFPSQFVPFYKQHSFVKGKRETFAELYSKLCIEYAAKDIPRKELYVRLCLAKAECNQPINVSVINSIVNTMMVRKTPSYAYELAEKFSL